jgi:TMEM175 potassium channel family protein
MNILRQRPGGSRRDTFRIEAFSDGVIAIAITLLILEIKVPPVEETDSNSELWRQLRDLWPSYAGFAISFFIIGIMWANHHNIYKHIKEVDHYFLLINIVFLFCVAFLPFPTAVLAEHLNEVGQSAAVIFYSGSFLVTACVYNLLWMYPSHIARHLLGDDVDEAAVSTITRRFAVGPPAYLAAFVASFFSSTLSLVILAALALLYLLPQD